MLKVNENTLSAVGVEHNRLKYTSSDNNGLTVLRRGADEN